MFYTHLDAKYILRRQRRGSRLGQTHANSPKNQAGVGMRYEGDRMSMAAMVNVDYKWQSEFYAGPNPTPGPTAMASGVRAPSWGISACRKASCA